MYTFTCFLIYPKLRINLKKYLLYSSVFAVFSEAFFIRFIIDLKLFYLIILINYFLLLKIKVISFNKDITLGVFLVFLHAVFFYGLIGIPPNFMLSQLIGITISCTFFYNLIKLYEKDEIIKLYNKFCLIIAIIGYPLYFLKINLNVNPDFRFSSLLTEPAHYAIIVIPACYYFLKKKNYLSFFIVFISLILSESSVAYLGCALMFTLPYFTISKLKYALGIVPFVVLIFHFVYKNNNNIKMRFDDTYESFKVINTGKFNERTNLSTYALLSNFYIAKSNFMEHPFGTGIGSHYFMYTNKYHKSMRAPSYIKTLKYDRINSKDAASLFIRLLSEFGIFGILIVIYIFYFIIKSFQDKNLIFEQGISIYLLLKLFRDGHYFPPEFFFFIIIFYYTHKKYFKHESNEKHISYN